MARGPIIREAVEILVASIHDENPEWKAPRVREQAAALLRRHNPDLPPGWPGLNSVQKVLAVLRENSMQMKEHPLDRVWSMGVSAQHGIPPDAVPVILRVCELWEHSEPTVHRTGPASRPSIREAQWVSRLRYVIDGDIEALGRTASVYAKVEGISQRLGHPVFDSTGLDHRLTGCDSPLPFDLRAAVEHVQLDMDRPRDSGHREELNRDGRARQRGGVE